jgi:hypothetical protein
LRYYNIQRRRNIDNWGGADIHIFVFTDCKNNRFQKKLIGQNTNIWISAPPIIDIPAPLIISHDGSTIGYYSISRCIAKSLIWVKYRKKSHCHVVQMMFFHWTIWIWGIMLLYSREWDTEKYTVRYFPYIH